VQTGIQGDLTMTLKQTRLVTTDVATLTRFYESVSQWVMPPKVMPWGARAIVFRDPDGNLVNMYSHPIA
jgi:predicted enzyme related to lactoylglutathione lyase